MPTRLTHPFTRAQISSLRIGQQVRVTGLIFTGRDRLHRFLADGGEPGADLANGAIFHCGPVVVREQGLWSVRAAGPTTSIREEPYMPEIIRRFHVRAILGKGGMGPATLAACARYGCVYLHLVGGAAQVLADHVRHVRGVRFLDEFGSTEAMWELEVADLPALVTMDAHGASWHDTVQKRSGQALARLIQRT